LYFYFFEFHEGLPSSFCLEISVFCPMIFIYFRVSQSFWFVDNACLTVQQHKMYYWYWCWKCDRALAQNVSVISGIFFTNIINLPSFSHLHMGLFLNIVSFPFFFFIILVGRSGRCFTDLRKMYSIQRCDINATLFKYLMISLWNDLLHRLI
jgi:hypothetical protein